MFAQPATPNLIDYMSFLSGTVLGPKDSEFLPMTQGVATGGSTMQLFDTNANWSANQWQGEDCVDIAQGETVVIESNDSVSLTFATQLDNPIVAGDAYAIVPDIVPGSLAIAQEIVNTRLACVSATMYALAVYNLAADRLINFAPDLPNQTYFQDLRKKLRLTEISVGVPSQASADGLATGILNPEQMKLLTLANLQQLKTPCGRAYLEIAQSYGRVAFGLT